MARKFTALLILCAMAVMGLASGSWASYWNEGNNGMTEANAYIIDSAEDLTELRDRVNNGNEPSDRYYKLTQNITLSRWNTFIGSSESRAFTGHFNGNGNTITLSGETNVFGWINTQGIAVEYLNVNGAVSKNAGYTSPYRGGITAYLKSGTIENCNFNGSIYITDQGTADYVVVGGIAGEVRIDGTIRNCRVSGDLTAGNRTNNNTCYAGGIAGVLKGGTIEKCRVTVNDAIYAWSNGPGGQEVNKSRAGGIVGNVSGSTSKITNCVVKGTVRSKEWSGGIVGYMQGGQLNNCYVLDNSAVEANYSAGGIAGYLGGDAIADSNWIVLDSQVSAVEYAVGGVVGYLNSGTVTNNRAYTRIQGRAQYKGAIIGYAQGSPNIWSNNYYNADGGASYTIGYNNSIKAGSSEGGSSHTAETTTMIDPVDPDPLNPSPFTVTPVTPTPVTPTPVTPTPETVITITTGSLPSGTTGTAYSQMLTADTSGVTWAVTAGSLPAGLTLDAATGVISGNPTSAGEATFTVTASKTGATSASKQFTITINAVQSRAVITIMNTELFSGIVGTPYRTELVATTTSSSALQWSVSSGSLPDGLSMSASSGIITGTPTKAGEFRFTVYVSDGSVSDSKQFTIIIEPSDSGSGGNESTETLSITTSSLPDGTVGTPYSGTLNANVSNVRWRVSSGTLPDGLQLSSTGTISGTPRTAGTYSFEITADSGQDSAHKTFTLVVNASGSLAITTSSLPNAVTGTEYRANILANMPSVSWEIDGALPPGLDFNTSSGQIAGIPTSSGTYNFTVIAIGNSQRASKVFTIIVSAPVQQDNNNSNDNNDSSGGGGCDVFSGMGMLILSACVLVIKRVK
mgnify:CR=1 FL=1